MQLQQLKCSVCGANLQYEENSKSYFCEHCRSVFKVKLEIPADIVVQLNIAGNERENYAFSRARKAYENIIEHDGSIVEAYWGLLLSKYGIEFIEDKRADTFVPTCHRASSISIFDDPIYNQLNFMVGSDSEYIQKAKQIERIRQKIIETAQKELPYDIFICYKELSGDGNPTSESLQANDLYHMLADSGYKVFFARKSLDKLAGSEYEPVIYNALNTASIMLLFCNKIQYVESPWVKNEWGRFNELIGSKADSKKIIVPILCGLDPNALPLELTRLQGLDISKVGFEGNIRELVAKTFGKTHPDVKFCNHCLSLTPFNNKYCAECGASDFSLTSQSAFNASKAKTTNANTNSFTAEPESVLSKPKMLAHKISASISGTFNKVSNNVMDTISKAFDSKEEKEARKVHAKQNSMAEKVMAKEHKKEEKRNKNIDPFKFEKTDPFVSNKTDFNKQNGGGHVKTIVPQKKLSKSSIILFAILTVACGIIYPARFLGNWNWSWTFNAGFIVFVILLIMSCYDYNKKSKIQKFVSAHEVVTVSVVGSMLKSKDAISETRKYIQKMMTSGELVGYRLDGDVLSRC